MRFEEAYGGWQERRLTQEEAARLLGVCERTFRRYIDRYEEAGLEGLIDKRLGQVSHLRAPVDEVVRLVDSYRDRHEGWNARHFHAWYRREGGARSYTWVKSKLQEAGAMARAPAKGKHRKRRERSPLPGMMLHQDGSTHRWTPGGYWDLIVTMDDATGEHYSLFFVEQEGTWSSLQGVREVVEARGLFSSFYSDRGSHYWHTPEAGGKVDKDNPTQFGRAMRQLGIGMVAAYSPEARGRSERAFATHQGGCRGSWRWRASPTCGRPTATCGRCTGRRSTRSSPGPPRRKGRPSCLSRAAAWTTSCASSSSARRARTTACCRGARPSDPRRPAPPPLRQGENPGAPLRRRHPGAVPRPPQAGALRRPGAGMQTLRQSRCVNRFATARAGEPAPGYAPSSLPRAQHKADNLFATKPDSFICC